MTLPKKITIFLDIRNKEENQQLYALHLKEVESLQLEILKQMVMPGDALFENIMKEIKTHQMQAKFHNPTANIEEKMQVKLYFQQFTSGVLKENYKNLQ